jgi:hypothetical protein
MDNSYEIRKDTVNLLSHYLGEHLGIIFEDGYGDEILPVYLHNAYLLLLDHIGQPKAKEEIDKILSKNSKTAINYE